MIWQTLHREWQAESLARRTRRLRILPSGTLAQDCKDGEGHELPYRKGKDLNAIFRVNLKLKLTIEGQ